jgi:hypothetical protein
MWQYLLIISIIPAMENPKFKLFFASLIIDYKIRKEKEKSQLDASKSYMYLLPYMVVKHG